LGDAPRMAFLIASFSKTSCGADVAWPIIRYRSTGSAELRNDFSRSLSIDLDQTGDTHVLIPAYWGEISTHPGSKTQFAGIDLPREQVSCLTGLSKVTDPSQLPLVLWAILPPDWQSQTLYQRLSWGMSGRYYVPARMSDETFDAILNRNLVPRADEELVFIADIVHRAAD